MVELEVRILVSILILFFLLVPFSFSICVCLYHPPARKFSIFLSPFALPPKMKQFRWQNNGSTFNCKIPCMCSCLQREHAYNVDCLN